MHTYYIFVNTHCTDDDQRAISWAVINWVGNISKFTKKAGVKVFLQPVSEEDLALPDIQRNLRNKYKVSGFPALFIPETEEYKSQTIHGFNNIKKAMEPVIRDGKILFNNELHDIAAMPTDIESHRHKILNEPDEPDKFGEDTLSSLDIHRAMAKFSESHSHINGNNKPIEAVNKSASETKSSMSNKSAMSNISGSKKPTISGPSRPSNVVDSDDTMMSKFYESRIDMGDPNFS